jgi:hypothetical protein
VKVLSKHCHNKGAESPSFECFNNMQAKNPKAYFIFYDHILKVAGAGQTCWKERSEDGAVGNLKPSATLVVEAFAWLCLENHEKHWLHEAKVIQGNK